MRALLTATRPETEDADELLRRREEAVQHVPAERLTQSARRCWG